MSLPWSVNSGLNWGPKIVIVQGGASFHLDECANPRLMCL